MYGCVARPACGKVCKLVSETTKLPGVGYGYECESVCIPRPSRAGCKHCETACCGQDDIKGCPPKFEFCWYDWFACGCAKPRTIKLLTKYQAEREIYSYRWEVVDAACCDGATHSAATPQNPCVYKPAPVDAEIGDVLALSDAEWAELAPVLTPQRTVNATQVAEHTPPAPTTLGPPPEKTSVVERLERLLRR
jgi:hypothetical protein